MSLRLKQPEAPPVPPQLSTPALNTAAVQMAGHTNLCEATLTPGDACI